MAYNPTNRKGGNYRYYGQGLNAIQADDTEANRTITISDMEFEDSIDLHIDIVQSAGTAVVVTPYFNSGDGTYRQTVSRDIDAGIGTCSLYSDSLAISANTSYCLTYDASRAVGMKFIISVTNGGSSDTITTYAVGRHSEL